jgi:hypothetical protein
MRVTLLLWQAGQVATTGAEKERIASNCVLQSLQTNSYKGILHTPQMNQSAMEKNRVALVVGALFRSSFLHTILDDWIACRCTARIVRLADAQSMVQSSVEVYAPAQWLSNRVRHRCSDDAKTGSK